MSGGTRPEGQRCAHSCQGRRGQLDCWAGVSTRPLPARDACARHPSLPVQLRVCPRARWRAPSVE
eukprot:1814016-Alexandrium_andersonii.AAC.1